MGQTLEGMACLGSPGFVVPIGGKRREEPRSPARDGTKLLGDIYPPSPGICATALGVDNPGSILRLCRLTTYRHRFARAARVSDHVVTAARLRRPPRFAWRAPRRAAASRQQGLTTLGNAAPAPRAKCND